MNTTVMWAHIHTHTPTPVCLERERERERYERMGPKMLSVVITEAWISDDFFTLYSQEKNKFHDQKKGSKL